MVLGEEDPGDVKYENTADLKISGRSFENQAVYGDKKDRDRRDVFPGNDVRKRFRNDLPGRARVEWQGKTYPARISFRARSGGGAVPVYEFYLDAENRRQLQQK